MHFITGQSLGGAVMIRMPVMNVVKTLRFGSNPESLLAIHKQHRRSNRRAVESGDHIAQETAVAETAHTQPRPHAVHGHPDRACGPCSKRYYAITRWMIHLLFHVVTYRTPISAA